MQEGHLRSPRGQFLGADLEGRAQLHVHGTHEVFFKLKKGPFHPSLGTKLLCDLLEA